MELKFCLVREMVVEVWHEDRFFMEGYRGKIWEYLRWLVYEKGDESLWG